jgi:hypothetical protein
MTKSSNKEPTLSSLLYQEHPKHSHLAKEMAALPFTPIHIESPLHIKTEVILH